MAKNGYFNTAAWSASSGGTRYLTFSWKQESQSYEKNTTTISYTLKGAGTYTGWVNVRNIKLIVNGTTVYTAAGPIKVYNGTVLKSGTMTITHTSAGTRQFNVSAECGIYYSTINSKGSSNPTLEPIPRASTITAVDGYIGSKTKVTIKKASASYGHRVRWNCSGLSGLLSEANGTGVIDFEIPTSIYAKIPNDTSAEVTLVCETLLNGTTIGSTSCKIKAMVDKKTCSPTVTCESITNGDAATLALLNNNPNKFVQGVSLAQIKNIVATGLESAKIKSLKVQNGKDTQTYEVDGGTITKSLQMFYPQTGKFLITATDSRGYSTTLTYDVEMYHYFRPTLTIEVKRDGQTGKKVNVEFRGKFCNETVFKTLELKCVYTVNGETTSYVIAQINQDGTTYALNGGSLTYSGYDFSGYVTLSGEFDYQKEYSVNFYLSDVITKNITRTCPIKRGTPIFDWGENDFNFNVPVTFNKPVYFMESVDLGKPTTVDFVIEQGTKNVTDPNTNQTVAWGYRKWANGTGECWISREVTCNVTSKWGTALYYGTVSTINFPFKFAEVPVVNVSCEYTTADDKSLFIASCGYSSQNYARPIMLCRTDSGTFKCKLLYQVIGKWEE